MLRPAYDARDQLPCPTSLTACHSSSAIRGVNGNILDPLLALKETDLPTLLSLRILSLQIS